MLRAAGKRISFLQSFSLLWHILSVQTDSTKATACVWLVYCFPLLWGCRGYLCLPTCISEILIYHEPALPKPYHHCYLVLIKRHLLRWRVFPSSSSSLLYLSSYGSQCSWQKPPLARVHTRIFVELPFCSLTPTKLCLDNKMEVVRRLMW